MHAVCLANELTCGKNDQNTIEYIGQSPDEVTLVQAASSLFGYTLLEDSTDWIKVISPIGLRKFKVVRRFPFTSNRKRMSIVV